MVYESVKVSSFLSGILVPRKALGQTKQKIYLLFKENQLTLRKSQNNEYGMV